jgi:ATP-dependent Lhr-like helicase
MSLLFWVLSYLAYAGRRTGLQLLPYLLETGLLADDQGILWLGRRGEEDFGRRNFLEIFSVFQTPPLFSVRHGQTDLGQVHETSFLVRSGERPVLLLSGCGWVTTTVDWVRKTAYVEPSDEVARSRWIGLGQPLSFAHCQAIKRVLRSDMNVERFSRRAVQEIADAQGEFSWLAPECTSFVVDAEQGRCLWWTFAGSRQMRCWSRFA